MIGRPDAPCATAHSTLSLADQTRLRDELHSLQIGLRLLREEIAAGDHRGTHTTFDTLDRCLQRLANDPLLAATRASAAG